YREYHPFGRIPAFEHEGFRLFEAGAITRYVGEAFAGPPLQPAAPRERARGHHILSNLDSHVYRTLVLGVYVERVSVPQKGRASDEARIGAALPRAEICLGTLAGLMGEGPWLAGTVLTLADLHAAPMFAYFLRAPEAAGLMAPHDELRDWWQRVSARRS